jgi:hypothetical protein
MAEHGEEETTWPGILDEIEIKYVPVEYIAYVEVHFNDGNTWQIEIDRSENEDVSNDSIAEELEESIESLFEEYEDEIKGVNFVLDVDKVKEDITNDTSRFLKKKK